VERTTLATTRLEEEARLTKRFLEYGDEDSFTAVFRVFRPQLLAFYRARGCQSSLAEDLTQEVMFSVSRNAGQLRDRNAFRAWLFRIAKNALYRHYSRQGRQLDTESLDQLPERFGAARTEVATPAFEFTAWMRFLDSGEREVMTLRFVEQWEYHEIAAARSLPIGTVQWRVFNAKKKLAPLLARSSKGTCRAA
jgi:RNA polymerase sigma-70 factor (ECF subfamily)